MMHQPLGGLRGQAADIAIQAEQMAYTKRLLAERIAYHTGQTVEQVITDSDRDRWFTAEQAKDYGIIDHVIVKRGEIRLSRGWRRSAGSSSVGSGSIHSSIVAGRRHLPRRLLGAGARLGPLHRPPHRVACAGDAAGELDGHDDQAEP